MSIIAKAKSIQDMRSFMTILSDTKRRTFNGFWARKPDNGCCIDYIAVDSRSARGLVTRESHVVPDSTTSDHFPILVKIVPPVR